MHLVRRWLPKRSKAALDESASTLSVPTVSNGNTGPPSDDKFPQWPPPPPAEIVNDRQDYMQTLRNRRYDSPRNVFDDRLTDAFYRLYEFFALDYVYGYRNMLEYIWKQYSWSVHDIPDPQDPDTCRYAFLACVCSLLVESSNAKIKMGLPRDAPRIMSPEQAEAYRTTPEDAKTYERIPEWCERVAPLTEPLYVPSHDGVVLGSPDDERAEPAFKAKNIIVLSYHIHFT